MNILTAFERFAVTQGNKTAAADENHSYTFSQLRDAAARLGAAVRECRPAGGPVGVLVRRGADTAALFFAAVYGGCFYVPLDPDMPAHKLGTILTDAGVPHCLNHIGSLGCVFFTGERVTDYPSAQKSDTARYTEYFRAMLERGVYLAPSQFEAMFLSTAHTPEDLNAVLTTVKEFVR